MAAFPFLLLCNYFTTFLFHPQNFKLHPALLRKPELDTLFSCEMIKNFFDFWFYPAYFSFRIWTSLYMFQVTCSCYCTLLLGLLPFPVTYSKTEKVRTCQWGRGEREAAWSILDAKKHLIQRIIKFDWIITVCKRNSWGWQYWAYYFCFK